MCKVNSSEPTSGVGQPGSHFLVPCICMLERSLSSTITGNWMSGLDVLSCSLRSVGRMIM